MADTGDYVDRTLKLIKDAILQIQVCIRTWVVLETHMCREAGIEIDCWWRFINHRISQDSGGYAGSSRILSLVGLGGVTAIYF